MPKKLLSLLFVHMHFKFSFNPFPKKQNRVKILGHEKNKSHSRNSGGVTEPMILTVERQDPE